MGCIFSGFILLTVPLTLQNFKKMRYIRGAFFILTDIPSAVYNKIYLKNIIMQVTEKVQGTTTKDHDFMKNGRPINIDWNGKFLKANSTIEYYRLYLSTFPGG